MCVCVCGQGEQCLELEGARGKERKGKEEERRREINVSNQAPNFFLLPLWSAYLSVSSAK